MADIRYYLIRERRLGKVTDQGSYLFVNGVWVEDERNVIRDHLMGYDPGDDSPFGFGSLSIMDEIEEITEEEAQKFMAQQEGHL